MADIKKLRLMTSAPMSDCKKALIEASNDMKTAKKILIERNLVLADKKDGREQKEGLWAFQTTPDRRKAVMINLTCETDFVAKSEAFLNFCQSSLNLFLTEFPNFDYKGENEELKNWMEETKFIDSDHSVLDAKKLLIANTEENIEYSRIKTIELPENTMIGSYVHRTIVEGVGSSGNFVTVEFSQNDNFEKVSKLADNLSVHCFSMKPNYLDEESVPVDLYEEEMGKVREEMANAIKGKPEELQERILRGKFMKFLRENIVGFQTLGFMDSEDTIDEYLGNFEKENGVQVTLKSFNDFV